VLGCPAARAGRWRGEISVGYDGAGRLVRRKVSGQAKAAVQNKLKDLHRQVDVGEVHR
jgi:hypothetical protein